MNTIEVRKPLTKEQLFILSEIISPDTHKKLYEECLFLNEQLINHRRLINILNIEINKKSPINNTIRFI